MWLNILNDPCCRLARWALKLQQFDFEIVHREGKDNVIPDMLSRRVPTLNVVSVGSNEWLEKMKSLAMEVPENYSQKRVTDEMHFKCVKDSREIFSNGFEWKDVVEKDSRKQVLMECHDDHLAGHMGFKKTMFKKVLLASDRY